MSQAQYAADAAKNVACTAFALFQGTQAKSPLTKDVEEYIHTLTFVLLSTNHSQLPKLP